jgi:AcrR family transcriptional regulator
VSSLVAEPRPSPARERILRTVDRLFYEEGLHAVGINRVVEEAGVTRATLYNHFPSKDELIEAYLADRAERARADTQQLLDEHAGDARGALHAIGAAAAAGSYAAEPLGCTFIRAAAEFGAHPGHPARVAAARQRAWILALFEDLCRQAGAADPRRVARQLLMLRTGIVFGEAIDESDGLAEDFRVAWEATLAAALD